MNKEISQLKLNVVKQVDSKKSELVELSKDIHCNPELGFKEEKAKKWLGDFLSDSGFKVNEINKYPTAFKAVYGHGKPVIALLAEYDALPDLGHACGHNIIAVTAVGAAVASKCAVDDLGGQVVVIGTPAEELTGGKILLVEEGVFKGLDAAMLIHPGSKNLATVKALACATLQVEFTGKAAHAAGYPEAGINALDALILSYNAINALRQHIKDGSRIHGIITNGGSAANIVPDYASAIFLVRSETKEYLAELQNKVINCFNGAALATGAKFKYKVSGQVYQPMKNNQILAGLLMNNMKSLGRDVMLYDPNYGFGSTDMGNVSQVVPAIHPEIAISNSNVHTEEFAAAAVSDEGMKGLLDGAKAMGMTVVDLLGDPGNIEAIKKEFSTVN